MFQQDQNKSTVPREPKLILDPVALNKNEQYSSIKLMKQWNFKHLKTAENRMVMIITIIMTAKIREPATVLWALFTLCPMFHSNHMYHHVIDRRGNWRFEWLVIWPRTHRK